MNLYRRDGQKYWHYYIKTYKIKFLTKTSYTGTHMDMGREMGNSDSVIFKTIKVSILLLETRMQKGSHRLV